MATFKYRMLIIQIKRCFLNNKIKFMYHFCVKIMCVSKHRSFGLVNTIFAPGMMFHTSKINVVGFSKFLIVQAYVLGVNNFNYFLTSFF